MTKFRKSLIATALGLTLAGGAVAAPQGGMHGMHGNMDRHHERMLEHMSERLELTSNQQEQIKAILDNRREELKAAHEQVREQRQAVAEATRNGFDEQRVRSEADELGDRVAEATFLMSRMSADIREVLTPEQREKMEQMKQRRDKRAHKPRDGRKQQAED